MRLAASFPPPQRSLLWLWLVTASLEMDSIYPTSSRSELIKTFLGFFPMGKKGDPLTRWLVCRIRLFGPIKASWLLVTNFHFLCASYRVRSISVGLYTKGRKIQKNRKKQFRLLFPSHNQTDISDRRLRVFCGLSFFPNSICSSFEGSKEKERRN